MTDTAICREVYKKPNQSDSKDQLGSAGVTALISCPDELSAREEAQRIAAEHRRPVYDRTFKDKGKRTARFTVYVGDLTTNVVVARASS